MSPNGGPPSDALAQVRSAVASVLETESPNPGASLADDLGADSLDLLCIRMELEERLAFIITDEQFSAVRTVADLASLTDHLMARRPAE